MLRGTVKHDDVLNDRHASMEDHTPPLLLWPVHADKIVSFQAFQMRDHEFTSCWSSCCGAVLGPADGNIQASTLFVASATTDTVAARIACYVRVAWLHQ